MDIPVTTYREGPLKIKKPKKRIEIIPQKHLSQKYLLCGFAIHALLASPVYLYGILVEAEPELIVRIWPAVLYQSFGQIFQTFVRQSSKQINYNTKTRCQQNESRKVIITGAIIICLALAACGSLFSSIWITTTITTDVIGVLIYGIFGGIGSRLVISRLDHILEHVRPKEDAYVQHTIHLCGEGFCQIFLSFFISSLRTLYGSPQTLVLMGPLILNIIPLTFFISKSKQESNNSKLTTFKSKFNLPTIKESAHRFERSRDQLDGIELQQTSWRSPNQIQVEYMEVDSEDQYVTCLNQNGVEIMEIIPEEDETTSTIRSSSIDTSFADNSEFHLGIIYKQGQREPKRIEQFSRHLTEQIIDKITVTVINPMQKAVFISTLYPATFLQSADIFSYVMCLTLLPDMAVSQYQLKFAEIPFLFSLLAFPWMCFALMTPRFGNSLVDKKTKWHIFGCISKIIGLLLICFCNSKLILSLATIFMGFGQAVSLFLQDFIAQSGTEQAKWSSVQYPMYATNGLLIIIWGLISHLIITEYGFNASIYFVTFLYIFSIMVWYTVLTAKYVVSES